MATSLQKHTPEPLAALRDRLDAIDGELHRLLAERFRIAAEIGRAKGPNESVMRPAREAAVLGRRLCASDGAVPDETLAHIWRVIIAAACAVQRPYTVHVADSADAARFLYGPVEMQRHRSDADALAALAGRPGDVAVVSLAALPDHRRWGSFAHVIGAARLVGSDDGIVVLGGAGVETSGHTALVVHGGDGTGELREVEASEVGPGDIVLGLYDPFPVPIRVLR